MLFTMIEIACEHKTQLGEGPVWDEQKISFIG